MSRIENDCCDCASGAYPCQGDSCPRVRVKHLYCDNCGDEFEELYVLDGEELCGDCVLERLDVVK